MEEFTEAMVLIFLFMVTLSRVCDCDCILHQRNVASTRPFFFTTSNHHL